MRTLSEDEAKAWCVQRGLGIDASRHPRFPHSRSGGFRIPLPGEAYQLSSVVLQMLDATVDDFDRLSGTEHLLWLQDWSMWGELMTSIGVNHFDRLRLGYGLTAPTGEEPGMIFSGSEVDALLSFALLPLVFGWDFYIVPASGDYFVFGCHDRWIGFSGKVEAIEAVLVSQLQELQPEKSTHYCLAGSGALGPGALAGGG